MNFQLIVEMRPNTVTCIARELGSKCVLTVVNGVVIASELVSKFVPMELQISFMVQFMLV